MKGFRKFFALISTLFFSASLYAEEQPCKEVFRLANKNLSLIEARLQKVESKRDYESSVKDRFSKIEGLLLDSERCKKPEVMTARFIDDWQQMYMTLSALQVSAQLSAFREFDNWLELKEQDLTAFEYAQNAKW